MFSFFFRMTAREKLLTAVVENLKLLANSSFSNDANIAKTSSLAENSLVAIYKAGVSKVNYTPEEKKTIGPLVPLALQALGYRVFNLDNNFGSETVDSCRIERSGLQFLLDDFKDFPASSEDQSHTLEKVLKEFADREDIESLDERLKSSVFDPYIDDGVRSQSFEDEIAQLPSTHWWFLD